MIRMDCPELRLIPRRMWRTFTTPNLPFLIQKIETLVRSP